MKNNRYTFTLSIMTLFGLSALLLSVFLISHFYNKSLEQAYGLIKSNSVEINRSIADAIHHDFSSTQQHLSILNAVDSGSNLEFEQDRYLRVMWPQLQASSSLASLFVADEQGHFLQARREPELALRVLLRNSQGGEDLWRFVDAAGKRLTEERRPVSYDPRSRPWYQAVSPMHPVYWSEPYVFASTGAMGITFAEGSFHADGSLRQVAAADYTLTSLSALLTEKSQLLNSSLLIVDSNHRLLAHSGTGQGIADLISGEAFKLGGVLPLALSQWIGLEEQTDGDWLAPNGKTYLTFVAPLPGVNGKPWFIASFIEKDQVVAEIRKGLVKTVLLSILIIVLFYLPVHYLVSAFIIKPVRELEKITTQVAEQKFDEIKPVKTAIYEFDQFSLSIEQMVSAIRLHEKQQEDLIDAFIKILAGAIDAKSPYTGGHCERLPEIAQQLAKAAHDSKDGSFADFSFATAEEWREFRIAAWLHDCGKVVTPEYVVDKATKLETIYNRIHEIRMRFEVLHRDAIIHFYRQCQKQPENQEQLEREMLEIQQQLQEDFAFLAECNIGNEFMDDGKVERILSLAGVKWTRYFDDRLGLSQAEEHRIARLGLESQPLPAQEFLLADKAEHQIERDKAVDMKAYAALGSKMLAPALARNLGEIYNLCIRRGTLTEEERFTVNEHILATIKMLEQIPFTKDLCRVPEYAGGHHERMDGKGYPRQLTRDQLSIPARIMAIADVFEALTASDRPYKKAKTLSESLKIMSFMKKEGHIDPELFDLFLTSGIYKDYAKRFLKPEQYDEVNIEELLG